VILALAAGVGVQAAARVLARVQFSPGSLGSVFAIVLNPVTLLPVALIAVFCVRASLVGGWRSVRLVLAATLVPLGFLTYQGELASLGALASDSWTAVGLGNGLTTIAAIVAVAVAGAFAVWAGDRLSPRRSDDQRSR
jgi:hypothetical protein